MATETSDIVAQAVLKTGHTSRYIFIKALQASGMKMAEDRFDDLCLAYKNHGELDNAEFVVDFCIDVMRGAIEL